MAKLSPRTNKKEEARRIASELLKENEYVYNPRENTYQLVSRKTGKTYTGPLGGLDADKGLLQSDRKLKRLIGEQLSHQRHLVSREPVKTSVKDDKSKTEGGTDETSTGTTSSVDIKEEKIKQPVNTKAEELASPEDIMAFKLLEDEDFTKLDLPIADKLAKITEGKSQKEKEAIIKIVEERMGGPVEHASSLAISRNLPFIDESKLNFPGYIPELGIGEKPKSGLSAHNYPINKYVPKEYDASKLPKSGLSAHNYPINEYVPGERDSSRAGVLTTGSNVEYKKCGGRLKPKHENGGKAVRKYQNSGKIEENIDPNFNISTLAPMETKVGGVPISNTNAAIKSVNSTTPTTVGRMDTPKPLKSTLERAVPLTAENAELKPVNTQTVIPEKENLWTKTKGLVQRYTSQDSGGAYDADTRSLVEKGLDYANPALTLTDYLVQRNALKDIGEQKSVRTYNTPTQLNIRAASDLPYEVLVARENAINRMRSDYKGSDPVMELVSKQMVGSEKQQAKERLGAERVEHIRKEQARVDELQNKNRMLSGETQKENLALKRQYDETDRQHQIDIDNRQASLTGQLIGTTAQGIENRLNTRDTAALKAHEVELKQIGSDIAYYSAIVRDTDGSTPEGRNEIRKAQEELSRLQNQQKLILGEVGGKYTQLGKDVMLGMKTGGKLVPRK
jgi:hypothetical protein